jgi:hypothetical protein
MEDFTNATIDTTRLPKFEEVAFSKLHPSYWKINLITILILFLILGAVSGFFVYNLEELTSFRLFFAIAFIILFLFALCFSRIAFNKKAFAFRDHDVLYKNGVIATNTTIIPYNRIQHVALHEGLLSRYFGLAKIQLFTAGGSSSDIAIPGIEKAQAENIKQLLMGKIQKQL